MKPGRYYGIVTTSSLPGNIAHKVLHHTDTHAGRTVQYWEVWVKDRDEIPPAFPDNELRKEKVRLLDRIFNNRKNKYKE